MRRGQWLGAYCGAKRIGGHDAFRGEREEKGGGQARLTIRECLKTKFKKMLKDGEKPSG